MKFEKNALVALLVGAILGIVGQVRLERKLNKILDGQGSSPAPQRGYRTL